MTTRKRRGAAQKQPRYVTVVPVGQPAPLAGRQTKLDKKDRSRLAYRLMASLDDALRTLMKRRGEMSRYLIEALDAAPLLEMDLVNIRDEGKAPEVNLYIPAKVHARVKAAAKRRGVSHNTIVNSAMARWLAERGLVGLRTMAAGAGA